MQSFYEPNELIKKYNVKKDNFVELLSCCLGKMRAIQYAFGDIVVKNSNYLLNLKEGNIEFNGKKYPINFIGTESSYDNTWMWGWNNVNNFDTSLLSLPVAMHKYGLMKSIDFLVDAQVGINEKYNGHNFSIITCGFFEHNYCYYRIPHSGGAVYVALRDVDNRVFEPINSEKFISITMECIKQYELNHKIFIESFLTWNKTKYEWISDYELVVDFNNRMIIGFDEKYRITSINNYNEPVNNEYAKKLKDVSDVFNTLKSLKELNLDSNIYSLIIEAIKGVYNEAINDGVKAEDIQYVMDFYNEEKKYESKTKTVDYNLDPFTNSPFNEELKNFEVNKDNDTLEYLNKNDNKISEIDSNNSN